MTEFKFNKLTPLNDVKIDPSHDAAMKYALEDKGIKNVAISGNYGSGKSSFIETYKSQNSNFKPLHISLAHFFSHNNFENEKNVFSDMTQGQTEERDANEQINIIEGKIINQLLHQIDSKYIPMTIFKSKKNPELSEILKLSTAFLLFLLPIMFLWNYAQLAILVRGLFPDFPHIGKSVRIVAYLILMSNLVFSVYRLSALQLKRRLIKTISFRGANISGDVEVFQNEDDSYFDKYLDDVLYLFDNCQSDVIIFEDIDRFETNLIFEKLKEINTLVNNKRDAGQKLLFIYLVKDDMFISQDRTKFFDFIIPIIPVITSSNSGEKLGEILSNLGEASSVSKSLLKQVAIYIDDMRLTYNICNEFVLYKHNLFSQKENDNNKLNLSSDKIFAIIVYKNTFPKDFSLLQKDSGFVHQLFSRIDDLKRSSLDKKSAEIEKIEEKIISSEQEFSRNKLELYSTYLKVPEGRVAIRVNGKTESQFPHRLDFIREILSEDAKITSIVPDYYNRESSREETINSIFAIDDINFQERMNAIENRDRLKELNSRLEKLREEYESVKSERLSVLINRNFFDTVMAEYPYLKRDKNSLIMYLLRNGYIDESYPDYITYFYPNSLKKQDKEFLNAAQGEIELGWDYQLVEIAEVNDRLNDSDFTRSYALNFDLFEYLLFENDKKRLESYLSERNVEFVNRFLQQSSRHLAAKITVLLYLIDLNQRTLRLLLTADDILKKEKMQTLVLLISFVNFASSNWQEELQENLLDLMNDNWTAIQEIIDNFNDPINMTQIQDNLKFMEVKIKDFNFEDKHKEISDFVYDNNLYDVNVKNVRSLSFYLDGNFKEDSLIKQPITTVRKFDKLFSYIEKNIDRFVTEFILYMSDNLCDKWLDMYYLLNHNEVTSDNRIEYLKRVQNNILDFEQLDDVIIKDAAIAFNKARFSTKNILDYFCEYHSWNDRLIEFVNHGECLEFSQSEFKGFSDKLQEEFFEETVKCNQLDNDKYREIISKLGWHYTEFELENIADEKMSILIGTRCISEKFSVDTLNFLRDNYQNHVIEYLIEYIDGYLLESGGDTEIYHEREMMSLLDEVLTDEDKFKVIDKFPSSISLSDKNYSTAVIDYILQNKFDEEDLQFFISNYKILSMSTKSIFRKIFADYISEFLEEIDSVDKSLLYEVIEDTAIDIEHRRLVLANYIDDFSYPELLTLLNSVRLTEIITSLTDNKKPKVEITGYNELILEYLKTNKKIASYHQEGDSYRIYSRKHR
ncbi:DNA-binding protein [Streptococcus suis]|uniref:YobI family P-loop NTPase n=1 Tax=Streptococcus parasuis TaxID=1501662 RepID=UPI001EF8B930|nr:DNA-binding protein [Streptococcus parasuis]MDG4525536.1 DNA-binding protein [Streptococcus suis]ULL21632.1 DNA-binding protein [Streptococcus suis]WFB91679.1 DNA-binding protein [Streptococcus parasuis]